MTSPGASTTKRLAQVFRDLDPRTFPATAAVAGHLPVHLDDEFTFGLDLIVDGLSQALKHRNGYALIAFSSFRVSSSSSRSTTARFSSR
jgi:hypothetical protein